MKRSILTAVVAVMFAVVALPALAQTAEPQSATPKKGAQMTFVTNSYDFGDIARKGGDVECTFEFVNDGDTPLVITRVVTSCSCTKAEYSKKPIPAGAKSTIKIVYEPHKKEPGVFHKVIQIFTNTADKRKIVTVKGNSIDTKKLE
ncbi:MAG: DUF1573 domain-containing protein [Rikenellaceae bacterium]|nr:DUF1573 domain-containing protein [Rikenellaceae bacterium]